MGTLNNRPIRPALYWLILAIWFASISIATGFIYGWQYQPIDELSAGRQIFLGLLTIWIILSIRVIKFDSVIGLLGLEMPIKDMVGPGPKLIPWPLIRAIEFPSSVQQRQFPGNPEDVSKGDDKDPLEPGKVRPLRLTTGKPDDNAKGILDIQAAVEVLFYLRIKVTEPLRFYLKYGSIEGFWTQIRDTGQKSLADQFSQTAGLGKLISTLPAIMTSLDRAYKADVANGGVEIVESGLDSPDLSKRLAEAMRDLGVARSEAQQAEVKITAEGRAKAAAERSLIEETQKALSTADDATKAAYIGARVLGDKTTILGVEGITQAIGILNHITKGTQK